MTSVLTGLRELSKGAVAAAFYESGALRIIETARRQVRGVRAQILAFHRIVDDLRVLPKQAIPSLCITTSSFERLIELAAERFEILSLTEVARVVRGERPAQRDVLAITFDDGYRDVYLRAWPILRRRGLPATVFVPTGFVGSGSFLEHDRLHALLVSVRERQADLGIAKRLTAAGFAVAEAEGKLFGDPPQAATLAALETLIAQLSGRTLRRIADMIEATLGADVVLDEGAYVMSAEELREISHQGIELGAHTENHLVLTHEPLVRVRQELDRPRRRLEALGGRACRAFAYCNGLWSPRLVAAVRSAGYQIAVTTQDRPNRSGDDPFLLGRKTLWEGHVRGLDGRYSQARAAAHLHHLFGDLTLTRPVDGRVKHGRGDGPWPQRA